MNDMDPNGYDAAMDTATAIANDGGQIYSVGSTSVVTDFDPAVDQLDLGSDSIHNQIAVDTPDGLMLLHMFDSSKSLLVENVFLADLTADNFTPITDAHLQQDLSASLAWENGTGLVRDNTVYVRSHEAGLEEIVDFDPATDTISMFYLSVRGDSQLNFSVEETAEGLKFFSPITDQSITLRDITFDDLDSSHFEWRANQLEDNVAGRMGLSDEIDGFVYDNIYSGKSVAMAGGVDRAPYHSEPDYTGTLIGGGTDTVDNGGTDDGDDDSTDAVVTITVTGGSVTEADPGTDHNHDDGTSHVHDDGHRFIVFEVALDAPATQQLTLTYATADGTAVADTTNDVAWDYHETSGTLVFEAGEQTQEVIVMVHPDAIVEDTEVFTLQVNGETIAEAVEATGTIYDNDFEESVVEEPVVEDPVDDGSNDDDIGDDDGSSDEGQTYFVGSISEITDFDPAVDTLDLGGDSIHNQIPVDAAEGLVFLHMFDDSKSTLVEGVYLKDLTASNFEPIADAHLQQDLSAALAYENGTGLVRDNTVYVRSHEAGLEEIVDFDPATDTISMFYLSVRGDSELNFSVEETDAGVRFFSPITGQSITLRDVSFDDLNSSHFEWRANQIEDNVAGRMGLADEIDAFEYDSDNIFSGKSVEMAGLVDRAPYHTQPDYTGTPIGGETTDPVGGVTTDPVDPIDPVDVPDDGTDDGMDDDNGSDDDGTETEDGTDNGGDDTATPLAGFNPVIESSWGAGYVVQTSFTPEESVDGWTVQLQISGDIVNIWNADIIDQDGDIYTISAKDYNASVEAGQTISFGFQADGSEAMVQVVGAQGINDGETGGEVVGGDDGETDGEVTGDNDGETDGEVTGDGDGETDGEVTGDSDGETDGEVVGGDDGETDGEMTGDGDGETDGEVTGDSDGETVTGGGDVLNGPLSTVGTDVVDADGLKVDLNGVNWFGFETDLGVAHGLWARNMEDMLDDIDDFGFNMIRLPFAGELAVNDGMPSGIDYSANPELEGLTSQEVIEHFLDAAADRGIGVLLDMHRTTPGNGPEAGGTIPDETAFLEQWSAMADMYGDHPAVIGFDLYNEPHGYDWDTWADIAETAGNMLLESHPDELIIIEGVETYEGDTHWWGGNLQGVADRPIELNADDKLVYSAHEYATSVFEQPYFTEAGYDPETTLPEIFSENWGFIEEEGIAPVLLGEFGSTFENTIDEEWGEVLSNYLNENDIDWSIWSWNPNSGDTGGVVEDDWETPREDAFTFLLNDLLSEDAVNTNGISDDTAADDEDGLVAQPDEATDTTSDDNIDDAAYDDDDGIDMALDDSDGATGLSARLNVINDWDDGAILELEISNVDQAAHSGGWEIDFSLDATIVNAWDGSVSDNGDGTVTINNAVYNGDIGQDGIVTVGFQIDQGDLDEEDLNEIADFMFL